MIHWYIDTAASVAITHDCVVRHHIHPTPLPHCKSINFTIDAANYIPIQTNLFFSGCCCLVIRISIRDGNAVWQTIKWLLAIELTRCRKNSMRGGMCLCLDVNKLISARSQECASISFTVWNAIERTNRFGVAVGWCINNRQPDAW